MKTVTYKCDRCGAEDTTNKMGLQQVGVHVGQYQYYGRSGGSQYDQEWCNHCLIETCMIKQAPSQTAIPSAAPLTLEDLVHEIAYNAACEALTNNR